MAVKLVATKTPGVFRVDGKDNHFELRISTKEAISGKLKTKNRRFRGSYREAIAARADMQKEFANGIIRGRDESMAQLAKMYFDHVSDKLQPGTVRSDSGRWKAMAEYIGNRKVRSITPHDVDTLCDALLRDKGMQPQTVNRYRAVLSAIFRKGIAWGIAVENPVKRTQPMRPSHTERAAVDESEVNTALQWFQERRPDYARFLWLALLLGARRGEVLGLQRGDFNVENNTITICRAVKELSGGGAMVGSTKAHNRRTFTVDDRTRKIFEEQMGTVAPLSTAYIFSADDGMTPWLPNRISLAFNKMRIETGVRFTIHGLRRLATTQLLRAGVNPSYVQYRGGWQDAVTMMSHYADHLEADAEGALAALQTLIPDQRTPNTSSIDDSSNKAS